MLSITSDSERYFRVKPENPYPDLKESPAGLSQGSVFGPIFHLLSTCDFLTFNQNVVISFNDNTAILAISIQLSWKFQRTND